MPKYTPNQYTEIFYKLPKEIQDVVASSETINKLSFLGLKHKLQIDQIGILIDIVLDIAMGITPSKKIVDEIAAKINISKVDANLVVRDIDDEIFKPIKELMLKIYAEGAPFKPNTMQSVEENDDDHAHLDKDEILRGIEEPHEREVKVVAARESAPKIVGRDADFSLSTSKEVEEYHTEISLGKNIKVVPQIKKHIGPDLRSITPTGISNIEESKKRLLDSITSKKLENIFTMPRTTASSTPLPQSGASVGQNSVSKIPEVSTIQKPGENPSDLSKSGMKVDPYREAFK